MASSRFSNRIATRSREDDGHAAPRGKRRDERIVIVGGGIAGLATALSLAPLPVTVLTRATLETEGSTGWAQGGIAAAIGADDRPELHAQDTVAAGDGLSEPSVAQRVAQEAPACVQALMQWGVAFDRTAEGELALGLESVHRRRRILHAGGDKTGAAMLRALAHAARSTPSIEILERFAVHELAGDEHGVTGVIGTHGATVRHLPSRAVVLATGGIGGLYLTTTNPLGAIGSGLLLAARLGAVLQDLEFVQFHPTAIALPQDPLPLASEAIRGEGAVLVNDRGERFMADVEGAELAPRDIVARAIGAQIEAGRTVFLDARQALGARFAQRFPDITQRCRAAGLDPVSMPIPVRPAAHYHMGGVRVDLRGRSSVPGLWACGEVSCTGLHGANRLASNSLLEAVAFARWVAEDLRAYDFGSVAQASPHAGSRAAPPARLPPKQRRDELRAWIEDGVGVVRDADRLENVMRRLQAVARSPDEDPRIVDMASAGMLIAAAAWQRTESRGAHFRRDHPAARASWARHGEITLEQAHRLVDAL